MMYYLPTTLIFIAYGIGTLIYIIKHKQEKLEKKLFYNELLIAGLFFLAGLLFPFMYGFHSPSLKEQTLNLLWAYTSILLSLELLVWLLTLAYNTFVSKRNPKVMEERDYCKYCEEFEKKWEDNLKSEMGRKFLHLFTCLVVLVFWSIGTILDKTGILSTMGLDNYSFSIWCIVTIGFAFVIMFQIADLARLNTFYMLPKWAKKWYLSMRKEELETFIASTPLVLSFVPFVFTPFPIFAAVALITTLSDAIACVIGKKYGRHSLPFNQKKTVEGAIAGGISTFLIVISAMFFYHEFLPVNLIKIVLMGIVATIIFLIIDIFVKNVSDNILNPLLTGFGMWIISIL